MDVSDGGQPNTKKQRTDQTAGGQNLNTNVAPPITKENLTSDDNKFGNNTAKWGGLLMAIIFHFDRQLLGNNINIMFHTYFAYF